MRPAPSRSAFTLVELLVVISIIAILAGMLIPSVQLVLARTRQIACGRNQTQIALAMLAYASENDGAWPLWYARADGANAGRTAAGNPPSAPAGTDQTMTAVASQEFLAAWSDGELTRAVFRCPARPEVVPATEANPGLAAFDGTPASWGGAAVSAFAYDWSVPASARSMRVVLCNRPAADGSPHGRSVNAVFADGHLATLQVRRSAPTGTATIASDGNASAVTAENPDAGEAAPRDGVYDGDGDGGTASVGGRGSRTRAWAR